MGFFAAAVSLFFAILVSTLFRRDRGNRAVMGLRLTPAAGADKTEFSGGRGLAGVL